MIKGKLDYMPPEQLQGELDHRSDLFAVGVMLWEGVARRRLWEGLGDAEVMRHLLDGDIPALRRAKPDVDPELEHIVSRAIAADPEARYTSAAEFQAALERYLATRDGPVSEAALGGLIGELGADARRQTQELVASKLEELAAGPSPTGREAQRALPNLRSDAPQQEEPTASASTVALTAPARDGHRRATGILAGLGLAAFATMIWNARSPRAVEPERAPVSAPATKVERVRIEVTVDPPEAKIFFDGLPVESNPFVALVPKDALTHNVRALAPGFNPRTEALTLVSDVRLHLALDRQVPPALSSPKPSPLSARASARVKAPANACDPPYFLDESGIKRYRRECLSDGPASQR
jgi:hypothetical protein